MKTEGTSICTLFSYCSWSPVKIKTHVGRLKLIRLIMKHKQRCTQRNGDVERREAATTIGWDSHRILASVWYGAVISQCLIVRAWHMLSI